jgi:hypothetical protein
MDCLMHEEMVAKRFPGGAVYNNSNYSHFTVDNGTAHETTEIPGFGLGEPFKVRHDISPVGEVSFNDIFVGKLPR